MKKVYANGLISLFLFGTQKGKSSQGLLLVTLLIHHFLLLCWQHMSALDAWTVWANVSPTLVLLSHCVSFFFIS